ncbi:MAG: DNA mismatch repair protein MutS [Chitinophagales bacterium]|nr:DNA mismatch repair protein MutS [Chitinophagales bacterium]MDW8427087.1 DNA mismatch repair protein MutS [Chitinophagales bacterium]
MAKAEKTATAAETPLMRQYAALKARYPDAILLFRVGDFYETFDQDAVITSQVLGIVLTKRANGAAYAQDMAGFPYHALDTYLPKLVRAGYRVAICDQLEDPKLAKTIVRRDVTELITPGITDHERILDHKTNNFLCAIDAGTERIGLAFADISTGEFYYAAADASFADKLLQSLQPAEIIFSKTYKKKFIQIFGDGFYTYALDDWIFQYDYAHDLLLQHFQCHSLKGFGLEAFPEAVVACGAIVHYLKASEHTRLEHLNRLARLDPDQHVWMDRFTLRNLEVLQPMAADGLSLLQVMDDTITPMGSRMLRQWLALPLTDVHALNQRLDQVEALIKDPQLSERLAEQLRHCGDLERLIARAATGKIGPRDLLQVRRALEACERIQQVLKAAPACLSAQADQLHPCLLIRERLQREIRPDAPALAAKGHIFNPGVNAQLDELRRLATNGKDYLLEIQKREAQRTGITSLKVSYNQVFGYYLEVTHAHRHKVPSDWIRKQTLTQAERYVTPELKELEEKILSAESQIQALEQELFQQLVEALREYIAHIQQNARVLGRLDVLLCFARLAIRERWCRPRLLEKGPIDIREGRHPVIEKQLGTKQPFVPNDCYLDDERQQILIITGPNMAGKSAYIRQNALLVLMAQVGSFIPAREATIGVVDKIFTRVGASDNLSAGESTFMVEMLETASILNNATGRSLIVLDEIGRGTSTFDGISIAWAVAEYLHDHPRGRPRTLFATHYHELNELAGRLPRVVNYHMAVKEVGNKVLFLHQLRPGGAEHSFGIHVAAMAGLPKAVIHRAEEILTALEQKRSSQPRAEKIPQPSAQLTLFAQDPELAHLRQWLQQFDINTLTPVEALLKLAELKQRLL